jgi:hypothetical protein
LEHEQEVWLQTDNMFDAFSQMDYVAAREGWGLMLPSILIEQSVEIMPLPSGKMSSMFDTVPSLAIVAVDTLMESSTDLEVAKLNQEMEVAIDELLGISLEEVQL